MDTQTLMQKLGDLVGSDHWAVLAFCVILVSLLIDFIQRKLLNRVQSQTSRTENPWDDAVIEALIKPISLIIWLFGISLAAEIVFRQGDRSLLAYVTKIWQIGLVFSIAWFAWRLAHGVESNIIKIHQNKPPEEAIDRTTVDALGKLVRIAILITAVLIMLQELGVSISGVLAFGGVGGLAVGLAAKDLLANFFGGLTVYLDRPFKVGDWICSPDRTIEGTVERIGWRQTTIRKFDKRPIYVPNATFTTIAVENPSRMTHRRIFETIGIRYCDVGAMTQIVAAVEEMLKNHADIDQTQTLMVNFNAFSESSIDFFLYTFTKTTNWVRYHEVKQDVLLRIEKIISDRGAEIAFPTSTLHIGSMPPQFAGLGDDEGEPNNENA